MSPLASFLLESHDLKQTLTGMGMEVADEIAGVEQKFTANHAVQDVHAALVQQGFKMLTRTLQGHPMKPYQSYEGGGPYGSGGRILLHHRDGKVVYVVADYRKSQD